MEEKFCQKCGNTDIAYALYPCKKGDKQRLCLDCLLKEDRDRGLLTGDFIRSLMKNLLKSYREKILSDMIGVPNNDNDIWDAVEGQVSHDHDI